MTSSITEAKDPCVEKGSMYCHHTNTDRCDTDVLLNTPKEFTNDAAENVAKGAIKYDGGKVPVYRGFIAYFPRAIEEVARVSAFGASKYSWNGWMSVDDGDARYSDAEVRHMLSRAKGEVLADDSRLAHLAHKAWNAMAVLELYLKERENATD